MLAYVDTRISRENNKEGFLLAGSKLGVSAPNMTLSWDAGGALTDK